MNKSFLFISLFLVFPFLWFGLLRQSGARLLTISIPSALIWAIFITQYIGYPILFFHLDEYRAELVRDQNIIWQMFLWSSYSVSMIILGFVAARKQMGPLHSGVQFNSFHESLSSACSTERWILFAVFALSLASLFIYILRIGWSNVAGLAAVGIIDTDVSLKVLRSEMGNAFEGKYHWYRLFMRDFLSMSSFGFFSHWLMSRSRIAFFSFFGSFAVAAFSMLMATEKGPLLFYLIALLIVYLIVQRSGRLTWLALALCITAGVLIASAMYIYFMGSSNIWFGIASAFSRITTGGMADLYHYLTIFPEQVGYLLGRSFPNPQGIFPWEPYSLTTELNEIVNPHQEKLGLVGSMPTFFWGEMYANFGYLGIIVPPFFVGYVVYSINILVFRLPMSPLVLAIYVWVLMHIKDISITGLSGYIIDVTGLIILLFTLIVMGILGGGVIRYRRRRLQNSFARSGSDAGNLRGSGL
jgi:oligosaccharide repeat unit polymerase